MSHVFPALGILVALASTSVADQYDAVGHTLPAIAKSRILGSPPSNQVLSFVIGLRPRSANSLEAFANAVSDPRSTAYRHFMTPEQVGAKFGPPIAVVNQLVGYLQTQGLRVGLVAKNRMAICASGSVVQTEKAFGTSIKMLQGADPFGNRIVYRANISPAKLPSAISLAVTGVSGLDDYNRPRGRTSLLNPLLTRALYTTAPSYAQGFHGEGRTLGITNQDGLQLGAGSNAALYIGQWGLPTPPAGALTNVEIRSVGTPAWNGAASGEGDLSLQMALGMAPLAHIIIYDTASDYVGLTVLEANDNAADVISEGTGNTPSTDDMTILHNQHLAMSVQGMTYCVASGDTGTTSTIDSGYYPNIDPEALNVGGTVANVDDAGNRMSEDGWNGSGGGWDTLDRYMIDGFATVSAPFNVLPGWQHGNGVPTGINYRLMPDVGLHAAGDQFGADGHQFYFSGTSSSASGTSCSAPIFAGSLITLEQRLASFGMPPRMGRIQDMVYSQNGRSDVWFDVTTGSSGTLPDASSADGHAGWDFVTGWGAPNFDALFSSLIVKPISGTITLQNYNPSAVAGSVVSVQLYYAGTSTLVDTRSGTLDSSGHFSVSTSALAGNYDVYVKASHWLRRKAANCTLANSGLSGLNFSLVNGDVNGDNHISLTDFAEFKSGFGLSAGQSGFDPNTDLNGDGRTSLLDFAILKSNFGQIGD